MKKLRINIKKFEMITTTTTLEMFAEHFLLATAEHTH